ncbi:hypothetical protein WCD74_01255 [Actinomycetospora sp. OC33-EN08]|uniref:Uncharacterized protein n=1 Tax=Actinomycetospora aurantiaca TaxID=3129233 RepID=A0ABU8MGC8_9PSEU
MTDAWGWTEHDSALWLTCEIAAQLARGGPVDPPQRFAAPFPPAYDPTEEFWAGGTYEIARFFAAGDGSYMHHSGAVFGGGLLGLAFGATMAAGRAVGNSSRRKAAEAAATPRWYKVEAGNLFITGAGVYLRNDRGISSWSWFDILMGEMVGPRDLMFQPQNSEQLIVSSDWSELIFVLWAMRRFPTHHQLLTGGWLPPDWLSKAAAYYPSSLRTPQLQLGA